ncbi:MAG: cysteine--tRNA ligase [Pacificimonas sp.]|nr:cysteine--tRNA ligase [Pacificimonas sp.]
MTALPPLRLYDTRRREKVVFEPADPSRITMYVCGPTVYSRAHIGNFRPEIVFDVLKRVLRHHYGEDAVWHARNITDIDDKIMAQAAETGRTVEQVSREAEGWYEEDARALGVDVDTVIAPRATDFIDQMIAMLTTLIERGHAYAAEGHVLFDTTSDEGYGSLSRRPLDEMVAGARVEVAPYKKNAQDFVLWKPSAPDQPGWDSPWGRGRPGWHTECTAMIREKLGPTIDIHGGGQDLIFPHHENEAAQGRCAHDGGGSDEFASVWMHNGFLSMSDEKMSKSLGNIVTVPKLLEQGHRGETIRLAMLMAHYRQPLEWTESLLEQAKKRLDSWYRKLATGSAREGGTADPDVVAALSEDMNLPHVLARLSGIDDPALLRASGQLIGLLQGDPRGWAQGDANAEKADITARIAARTAAKAAKNYAEADRIRDELASEGIILEDGPDGTTWRRA